MLTSVGDLAVNMRLRYDVAKVQSNLDISLKELSTGTKSDAIKTLKGDFSVVAAMEHALSKSSSYQQAISERELFLNSQQAALAKLRQNTAVSGVFLSLPDRADATLITAAGSESLQAFISSIAALNTQTAGRTIFSGVETKSSPLASADIILSAIETEISVASASSAAEIESIVLDWFAVGGGFDTIGYLGGEPSLSSTQLSENELARPAVTAQAPEVREFLSALALGALLGRDALSGDLTKQGELAETTGIRLLGANESLVRLQASIGISEQQVERASIEVSSAQSLLESARSELLGVDPFQAAQKLQTAEGQLEVIYTVTARLANLSLVRFL